MAERLVLGCLGLLCGGMAWIAYGYSLSDALGPGAGFFPFWLGILGCFLSLGMLFNSKKDREQKPVLPSGGSARRAAVILAGLAIAALLLQPLGFRLVTLLFTAGLLFALGARRPVAIGLFALASSFGLFHVFYYWLQVPLPIGWLGI